MTPKKKTPQIDRDDVSQMIQTELSELRPESKPHSTDIWKPLGFILSLIVVIAGALMWATSAHTTIREWTAGQDFITKNELKEVMKENYVNKYDFAILEEKMKENDRQHRKIQELLDKLIEKVDKIRVDQIKNEQPKYKRRR